MAAAAWLRSAPSKSCRGQSSAAGERRAPPYAQAGQSATAGGAMPRAKRWSIPADRSLWTTAQSWLSTCARTSKNKRIKPREKSTLERLQANKKKRTKGQTIQMGAPREFYDAAQKHGRAGAPPGPIELDVGGRRGKLSASWTRVPPRAHAPSTPWRLGLARASVEDESFPLRMHVEQSRRWTPTLEAGRQQPLRTGVFWGFGRQDAGIPEGALLLPAGR